MRDLYSTYFSLYCPNAIEQIKKEDPLITYPVLKNIFSEFHKIKIIDFGCGGGWLVNSLSYHHKDKVEVTGVDFNPVAIKYAEEINLKINPNHLINSEWLLYAYGKPDILMNDKGNYFNIKGGFYDLDNKEKLEYYNSGITIKSGPNDGYFLVMKTL